MAPFPRVLFLGHTASVGGAELVLLDVARRFKRTSEVVLFERGPLCARLRAGGIGFDVLAAPGPSLRMRRGAGALPGAMALLSLAPLAAAVASRARRFDVVYANSQKAFVVGAAAALLARRPLVWHLHDILGPDHFSTFNRRAATALGNRCARRVITNSHAAGEAFVAAGGRRRLVTTVHNGIDPAPFASRGSPELNRVARSRLGVDEATPLLGVFGRLSPWKGQHVVLDALARVPGVHALIVGDALFGESEYAASLRTRTNALGIAGRAHFLGFREDVPDLLKLVDVIVHASTAPEPFGRVIVEGMLAGKPVIASRGGGTPEIVDDGVTGVLVGPADVDGLAAAIARVCADREWSASLAQRGREAAVSRFSLDLMLRRLEGEIRACAMRSPASRPRGRAVDE